MCIRDKNLTYQCLIKKQRAEIKIARFKLVIACITAALFFVAAVTLQAGNAATVMVGCGS